MHIKKLLQCHSTWIQTVKSNDIALMLSIHIYCDAVALCLVSGETCGVGCRVRRMCNLERERKRTVILRNNYNEL